MTFVGLDTHAVVKELKAAGFTDMQAEAVTAVVRNAQNIDLSNLATKTDLAATRAELKADMTGLKADLAATEKRLEQNLALGLATAKADLAEAKADILRWMVTSIGFQTVVILGAAVALARALAH